MPELLANSGIEILRQPLQTSITLDRLDFENFSVEEKLHIGISVRDFKAIIHHGETFKTSITASYSYPSRPMRLSYNEHGMKCEFTLMTIGEYRGGSVTPALPNPRNVSARSSVRPEPTAKPSQPPENQQRQDSMGPPLQPAARSFARDSASQRQSRPSPPPPRASIDHQSLFIPEDDDESRWGEKSYDDDEDQLGWGASEDNVSLIDIFRALILTREQGSYATSLHGNSASRVIAARSRLNDSYNDADRRVPPTQPISQVS